MLLVFSIHAAAEPVFVRQGGRPGSGHTFTDGTSCFLVTAGHVAPHDDEDIEIRDARRGEAVATVVVRGSRIPGGDVVPIDGSRFNAMDVIVAKVHKPAAIACTTRWEDGSSAALLLEGSGTSEPLEVPRVLEDGTVPQRQLYVGQASAQKLTLITRGARNQFLTGDSGSFLWRNDAGARRLVGMIVNVDSATGEILALPQKWLHSLIGDHIARPAALGAKVRMSEPSSGVNLDGSDFRFETPETLEQCEQFCATDNRCRSYTFVRAGAQAATAMCWLKYAVPTAFAAGHTTSGVKLQGPIVAIQTEANVLDGHWSDTGYPMNVYRIEQDGGRFSFTRSGQLMGSGEHFEVTGSGTLVGRIVKMKYTASYSTGGGSKGDCAGDLLNGPDRSLNLALRCTDTRLGRFATSATRKH